MLLIATLPSCNRKEIVPVYEYEGRQSQSNYPSGSTISYLNERFYIMGDDASGLLVLDRGLKEMKRIQLFEKSEKFRTPKSLKADIESSTVINHEGRELILLLGSGSFSPQRDSAFSVDPESMEVRRFNFKPFYNQLRKNFNQLNIEGAAMIGEKMVLGIRANRTHPENYLIIASGIPSPKYKTKILIKLPVQHAGLSGIDFDPTTDRLFITFSSEITANAYDDGIVGDSYLAIVPDITGRLEQPELVVTSITKLSDLSQDFLQQKIESVSLVSGKDRLLLVADDDNGNTTLFRLRFQEEL